MKNLKLYSTLGFGLLIFGGIFGGIPIAALSRNIDQLNQITNERTVIFYFMNLYIPSTIGTLIFFSIRNSLNEKIASTLFISSAFHMMTGLPAFIMYLIYSFHYPFKIIKAQDFDLATLFFACLSFSLIIGVFQGLIIKKFDPTYKK